MEKYARPNQGIDYNTIKRMRFAELITKTADRHSEYVIFFSFAFPMPQWLRERTSMLRYISWPVLFVLPNVDKVLKIESTC